MQFTTLVLASAVAMTASALPQTTPITEGTTFNVRILDAGTEIPNTFTQAAKRSLFVNLPSQDASCDAPTNVATFYIDNQELRLFPRARATNQKIFVDRSGMGMGKIGYITGDETLGRNWETRGWAVNGNSELQFHGTGIQACPMTDGSWSLWLQGVAKPGWNENCKSVGAVAARTDYPIGCVYSQQ